MRKLTNEDIQKNSVDTINQYKSHLKENNKSKDKDCDGFEL